MQVFAYARGWADLVVSQLAASHNTDNPEFWGYSCLCIGRKFDDIIEKLYPEIDYYTGPYLHIFSLLPPPESFLYKRINEMQKAKNVPDKVIYATDRLLALERDKGMYYFYDRRKQIQEKVSILKDLSKAGLAVDQYADFLFFDFRKVNDEVHIEVIAAKSTPIKEGASSYDYIDLFANMGKKAELHYLKGDDVNKFVKDLSLEWSIKIGISKALGLKEYIFEFINILNIIK